MANESKLTDAEWRARLSSEQYRILRQAGTEPPGSGALLGNKQDGDYRCAGCGPRCFEATISMTAVRGGPVLPNPWVTNPSRNIATRVTA